MNEGPWAEVEALFASALDREEEGREAWVRASATDPEIAEEVVALLRAHLRTGLFDAVVTAGTADPPALEPGSRLGAWAVGDLLGRGGMGAVYRVRRADGQFEQEAALKILRGEVVDDRARRHFLSERQILARLSHPNIARLLDGGINDDGRPWFVMELVDGRPIDAWCEARGLPLPDRLELLRSVCGAVQYAHAQLVVHRDLKPANVLVDAHGVPRLLDFGIAGAADPAGTGSDPAADGRFLTPGYSSPEQLRGDPVTTASDVYQLGLLVRRVVSAGRGDDATTAGASERDVAAIVDRATRPGPAERYASAGQLADDLERVLAHEPVRARPRTWRYVASRFARRHALPLAVAAAAFLLLLGAAVQIDRQARAARQERDRAEEVVELLAGLFQAADPIMALDDSVMVRDVLDRGVVRLRDELTDQPALRAWLLAVIGEVYASLGIRGEATALLAEALALGRESLGPTDPGVAEWTWRLAMFEAEAGDFARADSLLSAAEELLPRASRLDDLDRAQALNDMGYARQVMGDLDGAESLLERAAEAWRASPDAGARPAATYTNLGWIRISRGDPDSAAVLFRRGLDLRRSVLGPDHPATATSLDALGSVLVRQGALEEADSVLAAALRIREALVAPDHPLILSLKAQQAAGLRARGRLTEAEAILREILALRIAALGEEHFLVAFTRNDLGLTLVGQGRDAEAEPFFRASLEGYQAAFGVDHRNPAIVEANLARLLMRTGRPDDAEARFARIVPLLREAFPTDVRFLGDWVSLGFLRCSSGEVDAGLADLRGAAAAVEDQEGSDVRLRALNALAECQMRSGRAEEARTTLETSLTESADRADEDPYRSFPLALLARLGGG